MMFLLKPAYADNIFEETEKVQIMCARSHVRDRGPMFDAPNHNGDWAVIRILEHGDNQTTDQPVVLRASQT